MTLNKCLPVASGIGGDSADGAAALRAARIFYNMTMNDKDLETLVTDLGADMPVCIRSRSTVMSGSGGTTLTPITLPKLCAVLVNPGVQVPTGLVFQRLDAMGIRGTLEHSIPSNRNIEETIEALAHVHNDLSIAQNLAQLLTEEQSTWWIKATQLCIVEVSSSDDRDRVTFIDNEK